MLIKALLELGFALLLETNLQSLPYLKSPDRLIAYKTKS